jgi:hypothetical protein
MFQSAYDRFQILNCDLSVTFAVAKGTAVYGQPATVYRSPRAAIPPSESKTAKDLKMLPMSFLRGLTVDGRPRMVDGGP